MIIGYFSLFDLGLGRALTQVVAGRLGRDPEAQLPDLIGTALLALTGLGLIGGFVLALLAPWVAEGLLHVPPELRGETEWAFRLMGAAVPMVTLTSGFRGLLEARRWFPQLNLIRIPLGLFTFLGPWLAVIVSPRLVPVLAVLVGGRLVGSMAHGWLTRMAFREVTVRWRIRAHSLRVLLSLGGWMTVSNFVSPLMANLDRFVIGSMLSLAAVSLYATPYEMITKLSALSASLAGAMFPVISAARGEDGKRDTRRVYVRALMLLLWVLAPITAGVLLGAHWGVSHWISPEFAAKSAPVLQILAVGVFVNSLASIPFTLIQGMGRPAITAGLHLLELPLYLVMLWALIRADGIRGAAWAWTIRVTIDAMVLGLIGEWMLRPQRLAPRAP
jgi:O-antigen/teichoic acid export membrane protein